MLGTSMNIFAILGVSENRRSAVLQVTDASDQRSRLERCSDKGKPTHCFEAQRIPENE